MKILIAVPCLDMVYAEFVNHLNKLEMPCKCDVVLLPGALIYSARDKLAEMACKENYDYILFVDSDMILPTNTIAKLLSHNKDIVSGLYFKRRPNYEPVIYTNVKMRLLEPASAEPIMDYGEGLIEVEGCGMGCCLINTKVFKDILSTDYSCFEPLPQLGEDFAFCVRARNKGYTIYCDTDLKCGHIGTTIITEDNFKAVIYR